MPPELQSALAALELTPVFAIAESDTFMALSTSKDPEGELRMFRSRNSRVRGFALMLYATNEVFGRRVVAQTLKTLSERGVRVDGRWVGVTADALVAELLIVGRSLGCPLLTSAQRLQMAIEHVESTAQRAAGLAGAQR